MLMLTIIALLVLVGIASALTLVDSWVRGRHELERLAQERTLLDRGFVPMQPAGEVRIRQAVRYEALAVPARLPESRLATARQRSRQAPRLQPARAPGAA
jgi:hypothetical protein